MAALLNENIKGLRTARSINQVEFAKALGVTKQCVSNWENDNVVPSIEMLVKIADYFGVTTDYLLGRSERPCIDVSGLSEEQMGHVALIISDFEKLNQKET